MKILFWKHSNDYDKVYRWLIIAVPVVAAALSLWIGLRQSVWFDEAYSIMVAKRSASEIIRLSALDTHPPLYYLILKIWANVFGWSAMPGGETLKDVYARAIPYFQSEILPRLQRGENILLVSHGNTIRALMKYLDQIPDEEIGKVEMPFGTLLVYKFDAGHQLPLDKQTRTIDIIPPKA